MARALIDAALECFGLYGVRKTSLTDVAARAGVSRSTVYRAFGTHERLVVSVALAEVTRFFDEAQEAVRLEEPLERSVPAAIGFALDWVRGHAVLQRTLAEEPEQLIGVIVEGPGRPSPLRLVAPVVGELFAGHPEVSRLRGSPDQAAEWIGRLMLTLVLAPSSTFADHDEIARTALEGLLLPPDR